MAVAKQPKVETKRPRKRNATKAKGTKAPKNSPVVETTAASSPALDVHVAEKNVAEATPTGGPAAEVPVAEASPTETSVAEVPVADASSAETSVAEAPVADVPAVAGSAVETPVAAEALEGEIRKARKLLRANGYLLVPYRKIGRGIVWFLCIGFVFVGGACKRLCGWIAKKRAAMKVRREEKRRVAAEKKRLDAEAAARRAEAVKDEMRLAELRVEEARLKAIVANPKESVDTVADDSGSSKCVACGAELIPEARFCRKCGKPVAVSTLSV